MKSLFLIMACFLFLSGNSKAKTKEVIPLIPDQLSAWIPSNVVIGGYLGDKINLCISQRIKKQDVEHLITWIKLCNNLLRLTANPMYADQIEKTVYNALLASMKYDGSQIAKYSRLEGER